MRLKDFLKKTFGRKDPAPAPAPAPEVPPRQMAVEGGYVIFSPATGTIPFLDTKGCPMVYTEEALAREAIAQASAQGCPGLGCRFFAPEEMKALYPVWAMFGVQAVHRFDAPDGPGEYIHLRMQLADKKMVDSSYWINSTLVNFLIRLRQHADSGPQDMSTRLLNMVLPHNLREGLYLVPMNYEGESEAVDCQDRTLHAAPNVPGVMARRIEASQGKLTSTADIRFHGDEDYTWAQKSPGLPMHFAFLTNRATSQRMLAVFTSITELRQIYPRARVALLAYEDICKFTRELDGIVINAGTVNFIVPKDRVMSFGDPSQDPTLDLNA